MRVNTAEYLALPLEAHALLRDVPLRDVTAIDLRGGGSERSIADVRALLAKGPVGSTGNPLVRALFGLRKVLGRLFRWDLPRYDRPELSYLARLPPALARRSLLPPGTPEGPFRLLYLLKREMLLEARNATVHAFLASVLQPQADGYRLLWAVYVKPVSPLTTVYMALIEPFRRFLVYPSIMRAVRRRWRGRYVGG